MQGYALGMIETWRDRFRNRFYELKRDQGLTQARLGEMLGVSQGTIGHWLNGRRSPETLDMYEKLSIAMGIHPAWLLYELDVDAERLGREFKGLDKAQQQVIEATISAFHN